MKKSDRTRRSQRQQSEQLAPEKGGRGSAPPLLVQLTESLALTYKRCEQHAQRQQQELLLQQQQKLQQQAMPTLAAYAGDLLHAPLDPATSSLNAAASRRVLTKKAEPAGNGGLDNDDRNLIVRARDVLGGDSSSAGRVASTGASVLAKYLVLDMLGQGTFGQVFRCQDMRSKQIVAVKVIRNHPSYYKQAVVEVQVTRMLNRTYAPEISQHIVRLLNSFEFQNHLCIVFELLSMNVYELITENNFTGFPMEVTRGFLRQILQAVVQLADAGVIHCDLKPENILLAGQDRLCDEPIAANDPHYPFRHGSSMAIPLLKVVDFGSACMENETVYSYIQSRFYRSPEVLLGIPYNGAIDMWSVGCIAFEMLLGLPLFPGVSEHDQLRLIEETLGKGRNVLKFYDVHSRQSAGRGFNSEFVLKTPEQFAEEASSEVRSAKKYFKFSKLKDLVYAYPFRENATPGEWIHEQERRRAFLDFLTGLLAPDPAARWTARQALQHPFITGDRFLLDAPPLYDVPGDCSGSQFEWHSDASSYCYQQPPQLYTNAHQMDPMYYQQAMPPPALAQPQRVCPINAYYYDSSYPYYSGDAMTAYAYGQPWAPVYASAAYAPMLDGPYGYSSAYHPVATQSHEQQTQFYSHDTALYEQQPINTRLSSVPQQPARRGTQKVVPVPPTRSIVMPVHSPQYTFDFQRLEFPANHVVSDSYDPSIVLPLEHHHRVSVAPVDQAYQIPPKTHHHHPPAHKRHVVRSSRRRRIPKTDGPIVSITDEGSTDLQSRETSASDATHARDQLNAANTQQTHRQQKSKRRNELAADDVEAERAWKSPRSSNDSGKEKIALHQRSHRRTATHDPRASSDCQPSSREAPARSEAEYSAEPEVTSALPGAPMSTRDE